MALDHNRIEQYLRDTNEMIIQLGNYIATPEYDRDEADSGAIRRLRVAVAALEAACETLGRMPGPVPTVLPAFPPMPEPPPMPDTGQPAQATPQSQAGADQRRSPRQAAPSTLR